VRRVSAVSAAILVSTSEDESTRGEDTRQWGRGRHWFAQTVLASQARGLDERLV